MKMIKPIMAFMFVFALILPVQVFGQDPPRCEFHQVDFNSQEEADAHFDPALNPVCHDCGMTFGGEQELVAHEMAEHPPRCDEHDITFASHEDADQHFADEHPPVCPVCGESFGNWDEVNAHEMAEHPPHCDQHDITFDSFEAADEHFDTVEHDRGGGEGPVPFDAVDTSHDDCINLDEAFAFFGQGGDRDEFANGNDEDPGFNDLANEDEDDTSCGNDQVNRKEFFKGTYRSMNQRNDDNLGQATMANCAAWCAGIPNYKTKDQSGEWSGSMARYDDANCPCHPDHDDGN